MKKDNGVGGRDQKKNEEDFLRKEALRKRDSYVPVDDLNTYTKKKRREEGRKRSQKWYENKNKNTGNNENEHELESASSNSNTERLVTLLSHKTQAKGGFIRQKYRKS